MPGTTSQLRSSACPCRLLIQPPSCAVCTAVASRPAAISTRNTAGDAKEAREVDADPAAVERGADHDGGEDPEQRPEAGAQRVARRPGRPPAGIRRSRGPRAGRRRRPSRRAPTTEPAASAAAALRSSSPRSPARVAAHPHDHERHDRHRAHADRPSRAAPAGAAGALRRGSAARRRRPCTGRPRSRRRPTRSAAPSRCPCWRRNAATMLDDQRGLEALAQADHIGGNQIRSPY